MNTYFDLVERDGDPSVVVGHGISFYDGSFWFKEFATGREEEYDHPPCRWELAEWLGRVTAVMRHRIPAGPRPGSPPPPNLCLG